MAILHAFNFSSGSLEREYQAELASEKIRLTRILAPLALILNVSFIGLDLWAIPSALTEVWLIRGIMSATLVATFLSTWLPGFPAWYQTTMLLTFAVLGGSINAMILVAQGTDAALKVYFTGLIVVVMGLYSLTYVRPSLSGGLSLALAGGYAAIALQFHPHGASAERVMVVAQLYFLAATSVIGIVGQSLRDRYSRENYLLRHSLERDVELKDEETRRASYLAQHDPLTGLANRLRLEQDLNHMMDQARATGDRVAVMFLDLDGFKPVNDHHGHAAGDRVLKIIAQRLRRCVRTEDLVARVGGDEFVVGMRLPPGDTGAIRHCADKLAQAVQEDIELRGAVLRLSACIGIAAFPADGEDMATVLRLADQQMYRVKKSGKAGIALTPACGPRRLAG